MMRALDLAPVDELFRNRKALRRQLQETKGLQDIRFAVLGGSATDEIVNLLELLLLSSGFRPVFHQSSYGRYFEEAVLEPRALKSFQPDIVYVHTSYRNLVHWPPLGCSESEHANCIDAEVGRYREIWDSLDHNLNCLVIQNNFEMSSHAILGNMDAVASGGRNRFLASLNVAFAREAASRSRLLLQDVLTISSRLGLERWFDWERYFSYKILLTAEGNWELARSLNSMVRAIYGKSRKVLVLDLDNTLWGGVIGDDGLDKIQIGRETPMAEAYTAFQEYCLALRSRGILLAVCSKNDEEVAKSGFAHPSMVLKLEHFACFKANWEPKSVNIQAIANELNLGVDSFVFIDDNPAERAIVEAQLPFVAVPDVGDEVACYPDIIERGRYFEPASLSSEDMERAAHYSKNSQRAALEAKFADYGEYLDSLEMVAEIDRFRPIYLERIAQLTNKTNQFNLTTRRFTLAELEKITVDDRFVGVYGKLADRFGDNGVVSIVLGKILSDTLYLELWLMSCRVLKRGMEYAMLDAIAERASRIGLRTLVGYYLPSKKNVMVANFYSSLGFSQCPNLLPESPDGQTTWALDLRNYVKRNNHIRVTEYSIE